LKKLKKYKKDLEIKIKEISVTNQDKNKRIQGKNKYYGL